MKRTLNWFGRGKGRGIDAVMTATIQHAGIAMPRWAFIQTYLEMGMSWEVIERCAMAKPNIAPAEAARLESFDSACKRGWFTLPAWMKERR